METIVSVTKCCTSNFAFNPLHLVAYMQLPIVSKCEEGDFGP